MGVTALSVSPKIVITAEDYQLHRFGNISKIYRNMVNPPVLSKSGVFSSQAINQQTYPTWNFEKIVEPRFEGVGAYTGVPTNKPDKISEHHVIGLLRSVDMYIAPKYSGFINTRTKPPKAIVPPTGG